ncbi:MAG: hypothetical protein RMY64_03955 [Nostoc sp. DedQUE08]|nr:hypothetical protein [Nostoc sp. DedQUE08]
MGLAGLGIVLVVAGVSNVGAIARQMKNFEIYHLIISKLPMQSPRLFPYTLHPTPYTLLHDAGIHLHR